MSRKSLKLTVPALALLAMLVCATSIAQSTQRGFQVQPTQQTAITNGKYYALVIGINAYPAPLPTLKTAENDAQAIAKTLADNYGFDVKLLLGSAATRNSILAAINSYEDALQPNDNLLIYYAGHGYENKATGKAYWLPADADSTFSPNRIIADDITSEMAAIPARHVLVISDSCYSGGLTRGIGNDRESQDDQRFLQKMLSGRSRTLMASGGDEPVSDIGTSGHSVFAYALLQSLNGADQTLFTASDLFPSIRRRVAGNSQQLPEYAAIRGSSDEGGDFVFTSKREEIAHVADASSDPPARPVPIVTAPDPEPVHSTLPESSTDFDRAKAFYNAYDFEHAFPLMKTACDRGSAIGCDNLGSMYENGTGVAVDSTQAEALFRKACDGGYAHGCFDLGYAHEHGSGGAIMDDTKAVEMYSKACDGGDIKGCTYLGAMYLAGKGVDKDTAQAIALFRKACDAGDTDVCNELMHLRKK